MDGWLVVWVYRMGIRLIDTQLKYSHSIDKHKHEEKKKKKMKMKMKKKTFSLAPKVPALLVRPAPAYMTHKK